MCRTLGIFVVLFFAVTTLKADPVTLTGGTLVFNANQTNPFTLTGAGTVITGLNASLHIVAGDFLVSSGQTLTGLRLGGLDSQDNELIVGFPITVGGVTYSSGNVILLQLSTNEISPFTVPGAVSGFVVTAPLTLTGGVAGFNGPGFDNQFFSNTLSAIGSQTLTFRNCGGCQPNGPHFVLDSWVLTIGPTVQGVTVQSVPEPTSVLLLMTSVAALPWLKRRISRRN